MGLACGFVFVTGFALWFWGFGDLVLGFGGCVLQVSECCKSASVENNLLLAACGVMVFSNLPLGLGLDYGWSTYLNVTPTNAIHSGNLT